MFTKKKQLMKMCFKGENVVMVLLVMMIFTAGVKTLRNVDVIIPSAVKKSDTVTLQCKYDLENEPLYTVKWYKGREEFFRYIPKELPSTQIFPLPGIDVDLSKSTDHEVVLRHVQPEVTGRFKCEVSTDAPQFDTQAKASYMYVVEIPDSNPVLRMEKDTLEYGYFIRANCTSPSSYPAMNITWYLNGIKINATEVRNQPDRSKFLKGKRDPVSVTSYVEVEIDDTIFQSVAATGIVKLQCVASLFGHYKKEAIVKIEDDRPRPRPSSVLGTQGQSSGSFQLAPSLMLFWTICVKFLFS